VPIVLDALARRDDERRRLTAEIAALETTDRSVRDFSRRASRVELHGFLEAWSELLTENMAEARPELVLGGQRIGFSPPLTGSTIARTDRIRSRARCGCPSGSRFTRYRGAPTGSDCLQTPIDRWIAA
jgi:hypothetical protein